jgi:predicted DCC family thiol-disulfide oxidoreductase YuxK
LYDADCGLCRWTLGIVLAWDRRGRLRPVALQDPEANALLGGMDEERKMASWHLVDEAGRVHSAGAGFPALFRLLPGGAPLARLAARFPNAADRLYVAVASRRDSIGPKLPRSWVERATARVEQRRTP